MRPEEGGKIMNEWFNNLPGEIVNLYFFLSENVKKFQTFDLLSYFSYYNHLHDSEKYSDFRGDRNIFISEVMALLCLKNEYINESSVSQDDYMELIMEMQKAALNYCARNDTLEMNNNKSLRKGVIFEITYLLTQEAKRVRNSGLPDHHYIFTEKLFEPLKDEIKSRLGFSISDTLVIRRNIADMIYVRCQAAIVDSLKKSTNQTKEISRYIKKRTVEPGSVFTKEQLEFYSNYHHNEIINKLRAHSLNEVYYNFSNVFTFTASELSKYTNIELESVKSFLNTFSCGFPSIKAEDGIYEPITILKTKPIIEHRERYLIPSFPLLIWAVEDVIEATIKQDKKLYERYTEIKHNFVLNQGLEFFKSLLPTATVFQPNLFYFVNDDICETDGIIIYDKILFIIEAKANRITNKAKSGHQLKTQDHLKDIVRDSYSQGIRTNKYIEDIGIAKFKTKSKEQVLIDRKDFEEIVIISLTLEPIGNLSMVIKATNEIGYFQGGHFPWIISIYDLVILVDLFENPLMLVHYIKRREKFLSHKKLSIYDELDLISYYLLNGLNINPILEDADKKDVNWIRLTSNTDEINDYYMYNFGYKTNFTPKPKWYISKEFNNFLLQLDRSGIQNRVKIALLLLEFNNDSIIQLMSYIKKTKVSFAKDKKIHDCSLYSHSAGEIGVTFMVDTNKKELDDKLNLYCSDKMNKHNSKTWIGLGDISTDPEKYQFSTILYLSQ